MSALKDQIQALIDAERAAGNVPDISQLDISGCKADRIDARGADLSRLNASWLNTPSGPQFTDMNHLSAQQVDLTDSTFGTCDLSGSNMSGSKLDGTNLTNVSIDQPIATAGLSIKL